MRGALVRGPYKYLFSFVEGAARSDERLFDVIADPQERTNLAAAHPETSGEHEERLLRLVALLERPGGSPSIAAAPSAIGSL